MRVLGANFTFCAHQKIRFARGEEQKRNFMRVLGRVQVRTPIVLIGLDRQLPNNWQLIVSFDHT